MLKYLLFFQLCFLLFSAISGGEIHLTLKDGKILTTKDLSIEKNGDILFLHNKSNSYMRLPAHFLKKLSFPKPEDLKKADSLFHQKQYKASAVLYEKSAEKLKKISPWEEYSFFHAANASLLDGDREKSLHLLSTFLSGKDISLTEDSPEELYKIHLFIAQLYMGKKEFSKAYPFLDKLIASPGETFAAKALFMKGEGLLQEGKYQKALDHISLYLLLFPGLENHKQAKENFDLLRQKLSGKNGKDEP